MLVGYRLTNAMLCMLRGGFCHRDIVVKVEDKYGRRLCELPVRWVTGIAKHGQG